MRLDAKIWRRTLALTIFSFSASMASAALMKSSADFNHKYEGDYPVPNYTQNGAFSTSPSSDGNVLTFANAASGGGYFESIDWPAVDNNTGWTLEWRAQILDDAAEGQGTFQVAVGDGVGYRAFRENKNSYTTRFPTDATLDSSSNTDTFHIYRVAREPGSADWLVWRDGISLGPVTQSANAGGAEFLDIGSGATNIGGPTVKLDYFRFDTTGAYAPVPEPSSLLLLAAGGMFMWCRTGIRRRSAPTLVGAFLFFAASSFLTNAAFALSSKDSADFNNKYEGDYPVPNYTQIGAFTSGPSSDGDILTFATPNPNGGYFDSSNWATSISNATGWTAEWRMKVLDDAPEPQAGSFQMAIGDQVGYRAFRVFKNFFTTRFPTDATLDYNSNTDAFHTFRVAREPGSSDWLVWRDGVPLANAIASDDAGGDMFFQFGDGSTTLGGPTIQMDYVRFDSTGAYSPSGAQLLAGDYNNDGVVNAADYVLWRNGGPLQNDSTPGVQPADYDVWKSNFGNSQSSGLGSTASSVPEPNTLLIALGALAIFCTNRS